MNMFYGVVEDRMDPLKSGRIRVRILNVHTEIKTKDGLPTNSLMWAEVVMPVNSASISGIGTSPTGIVLGSWVVGYFRDQDFQLPVILGTIPGKSDEFPNTDIGFCDPSGEYPKYINESDVNRLARNENISQTINTIKGNARTTNVQTASGGSWNEPTQSYNAVYPYNKVTETESGHVIEVDDTPNNERLHTYHKSGSFEETRPEGSKIVKIVSDSYTLVLSDNKVYIAGNNSSTVDGNTEELTNGNKTELVNGALVLSVENNATINIDSTTWNGNVTFNGNITVNGTVTADVVVLKNGVDLGTHIHDGVIPGDGVSLGPVV